jgi:hypothetical protein
MDLVFTELGQAATALQRHHLTSLLESAIRAVNPVVYDRSAQLQRLRVRLLQVRHFPFFPVFFRFVFKFSINLSFWLEIVFFVENRRGMLSIFFSFNYFFSIFFFFFFSFFSENRRDIFSFFLSLVSVFIFFFLFNVFEKQA